MASCCCQTQVPRPFLIVSLNPDNILVNNSIVELFFQLPCLSVLSVTWEDPELKNMLCTGTVISHCGCKANKTQTSPQGTHHS